MVVLSVPHRPRTLHHLDGTGGTWTTAIEGYIIAADKFLKDYVLTPKGRAIAEKAFKKAFGGQ